MRRAHETESASDLCPRAGLDPAGGRTAPAGEGATADRRRASSRYRIEQERAARAPPRRGARRFGPQPGAAVSVQPLPELLRRGRAGPIGLNVGPGGRLSELLAGVAAPLPPNWNSMRDGHRPAGTAKARKL